VPILKEKNQQLLRKDTLFHSQPRRSCLLGDVHSAVPFSPLSFPRSRLFPSMTSSNYPIEFHLGNNPQTSQTRIRASQSFNKGKRHALHEDPQHSTGKQPFRLGGSVTPNQRCSPEKTKPMDRSVFSIKGVKARCEGRLHDMQAEGEDSNLHGVLKRRIRLLCGGRRGRRAYSQRKNDKEKEGWTKKGR